MILSFIELSASRIPSFFGKENRYRRETVGVLRSIPYFPALFERAMDLIKKYAVSGDDRARLIRLLLSSTNEAERLLGLDALRQMLSHDVSSSYPFEFGAWARDYGWMPRTQEDVAEWLKEGLRIAEEFGQSGSLAAEVREIVADKFRALCVRGGVLQELVRLACMYAKTSPWVDGWIEVRLTIRRTREKTSEADLKVLEELELRLRPINVEDKVRAFARVDGVQYHTDGEREAQRERTESSWEKIGDFCVELGQELARQTERLTALLPEIFAAQSSRIVDVGRGVAMGCSSLGGVWTQLIGGYLQVPEGNRNAGFLCGFLSGAMARDTAECEAILDSLLADSRLHADFVVLQNCAGPTPEGATRLFRALKLRSVPSSSFARGVRLCRAMDDGQLEMFLRELAERDGGLPAAVHILSMRIMSGKDGENPISDGLRHVGRLLIARMSFMDGWPVLAHQVINILEASAQVEDYELATDLCGRIAEALGTSRITLWDVEHIIGSLARANPRAVLDVFVEGAGARSWPSMCDEVKDEDNRDPIGAIPLEPLLEWARERPAERFPALARVVRVYAASRARSSLTWSRVAEKIIASAPSPAHVLDVFFKRLVPMSWSGSRAAVMTSRLPLLRSLATHERRDVAEWSRSAVTTFEAMIAQQREWEATQEKERNERFE